MEASMKAESRGDPLRGCPGVASQNMGRRKRRATRSPRRLSCSRRLRIEPLEERWMMAVVTVTTLDDSVNFDDGVTSLREAIFATNVVPGADTINFAPNLTAGGSAKILLTHGELKITDSLAIDGPGAEMLTIDASGSDPTPEVKNGDGSRVVDIEGDFVTQVDASIRGLWLTGGDSAGGGGAIFATGKLLVDACEIRGNSATGIGGGICVVQGFATAAFAFIKDSVIASNRSNGGGGIYIEGDDAQGGTAVIENCDVVGNTVAGTRSSGGGICMSSLNTVEILHCRVNQNQAKGEWAFGGGVKLDSGWVAGNILVRDSELSGNLATDGGWAFGGGLYLRASGSVEICGNRVVGNQATAEFCSAGGALIQDKTGVVAFGENTWADNRTNGINIGGGFRFASGQADDAGYYWINSQEDLLPGDFNLDGVVDAADYTVWRDRLAASTSGLEIIGDGWFLDSRYITWQSHFCRTLNVCGDPDEESIWDFSVALASVKAEFFRGSAAAVMTVGSQRPAAGQEVGQAVPDIEDGLGSQAEPDLRALGVPHYGSAGASPSRFNNSLRDDALLVWLVGEEAGSRERGAGSTGERGRAEGPPRRVDFWGKVEDLACDDSADASVSVIDDVFAGLALAV